MVRTICIPPSYSLSQTLSLLLERHGIHSGSELAKKVNLPIPTINRLLSGSVTDPRASTLLSIAEYFGISIDQLLGKSPLLQSEIYGKDESKRSVRVPILKLPEILVSNKSCTEKFTKYFNYLIDEKMDIDQNSLFAIEINDSNYFPTFSPDTILIVNKSLLPPEHNDYILVKFNKMNSITIKKFYFDPPNNYLVSVIPGLESVIYNQTKHKIIGVICEAYTQLK